MNIANTTDVSDIIRQAADRMHAIIGPTHPKMSQRDAAAKAAQHHIIDLFTTELLETWVTKDGPRLDEARIA